MTLLTINRQTDFEVLFSVKMATYFLKLDSVFQPAEKEMVKEGGVNQYLFNPKCIMWDFFENVKSIFVIYLNTCEKLACAEDHVFKTCKQMHVLFPR